MYSHLFKLFILLLTLTLVLSCSSGGGGDSTVDDSTDDTTVETTTEESVPSVTGKFIDSAVSGLSYTCLPSAKSGVTNSSGEFTCDEGDTVTFKLGDITLGSSVPVTTTVITPYTIFPDNDDAAINLAQLLQTIDSDLSDDIITPLSSHIESLGETLDFERDDFDTFTASLLSGVMVLLSEDEAREHLDTNIIAIGVTPPEQVVVPRVIPLYDSNIDCFLPYLADASGETKLADVCTTSPYNMERNTAFANGKYFFIADSSLFVSDGTLSGTVSFADVVISEFSIGNITAVNNRVFIRTLFPGTESLWVSDGSEAGTKLLTSLMTMGSPISFGDKLFFSGYDVNGYEPWITDGTISGTKMLRDINIGGSSYPNNATVLGDKLFFRADDGVHGNEPWVSDGTLNGTKILKDLYSGVNPSSPTNIIVSEDKLFFRATGSQDGLSHIWVSDGTEAGTKVVPNTASLSISSMINVNNIVYYTLYNNNKIYRVDEGGTYEAASLPDDETSVMLFRVNNTIYAVGGSLPPLAPALKGIALPEGGNIYKGYIQSDADINFTKIDVSIAGTNNITYDFITYMSIVGDSIYMQISYTNSDGDFERSIAKMDDGVLTLIGDPYVTSPD